MRNFSANIRRNVIHLFDKYEKMSWQNDLMTWHAHTFKGWGCEWHDEAKERGRLEGHKIYLFVDLAAMTKKVSFHSPIASPRGQKWWHSTFECYYFLKHCKYLPMILWSIFSRHSYSNFRMEFILLLQLSQLLF